MIVNMYNMLLLQETDLSNPDDNGIPRAGLSNDNEPSREPMIVAERTFREFSRVQR